MGKHYRLSLSADERQRLHQLIHSGAAPARVQTRARILLLADYASTASTVASGGSPGEQPVQARTEQEIADAVLCSKGTVGNVRKRYQEGGVEAALYEKPRPGQKPKITGEVEATLVSLACSAPPEGHSRWTLQMLADKLVELNLVNSLSDVAVYKRLKKTLSDPGK